mgnify:FL=1
MIIEPPKTVLDFKRVEKSILEMMANPYCDIPMFESLEEKLKKCRAKIKELGLVCPNNEQHIVKKEGVGKCCMVCGVLK